MGKVVLVLAAGIASRYGAPKQLERFGPNRWTLAEYALREALRQGFTEAICVIRRECRRAMDDLLGPLRKKMTIDFAYQELDDTPPGVKIPPERKKPWGTTHAVYAARKLLTEPFATVNADDFYGEEAWATLGRAMEHWEEKASHIVTYKLGNTLSINGPVSRGICSFKGDHLQSIEEFHGLQAEPGGGAVDGFTGKIFSRATPVSMNFFFFQPSFLDRLGEEAELFFSSPAEVLKTAEWTLPMTVNRLLRAGKLSLFGIATNCPWHGLTHPKDRKTLADALCEGA